MSRPLSCVLSCVLILSLLLSPSSHHPAQLSNVRLPLLFVDIFVAVALRRVTSHAVSCLSGRRAPILLARRLAVPVLLEDAQADRVARIAERKEQPRFVSAR